MGERQVTLIVSGMTCSSCEARITSALRKTAGVIDAKASLKGGTVWVEHDEDKVGVDALKAAIEKVGYTVKDRKSAAGTMIALGLGVTLVAAYMIATQAGLFNALPKVDASIGYGMLFVIGLLTSVHCVAMCGGIALSQSLGLGGASPARSTSTRSERLERLGPGLLYNGGRVLSYTIVGGIVGALGSAFSFSPIVKGLIAAAAGLFMVLFGLKMLGVISKLPSASRFVPARLKISAARLGASFRKRGPFAVGILNGLMPCGPLQTMQLYALGTGSAFAGALSMLIFSAGTVPLMLVFGFAAALLPRKFVPVMVRASAILVMFLGVVTFARAASLAGIALPSMPSLSSRAARAPGGAAAPAGGDANALTVADKSGSTQGPLVATLSGDTQTITTAFTSGEYVPFVVQAGVPLKWIIRVTADDLNGCNNPVTVPAYGIRKTLVPGDNLVEFTPKKEGVIGYTCWMGMISSRITVLSDLSQAASLPPDQARGANDLLGQGGAAGSNSGGCCSGASNPAFAGVAARGDQPFDDTIGVPVVVNGIQEITVNVTGQGYAPAALVLQKGMRAVIKFKAEIGAYRASASAGGAGGCCGR